MKFTISNNDSQLLSRQPAMHEVMLTKQLKDLGSKGGKARAENLTIKQRKTIASKAAKARWSDNKEK